MDFDCFGGKYVPEVLRRPLDELEAAFNETMRDPNSSASCDLHRNYIGRPTPFLFAENDAQARRRTDLHQTRRPRVNTGVRTRSIIR